MTDMQVHLDKIRSDAAECILLSSLAPNGKSEMFVKIAEHLNSLAFEIERTMAIRGANVAPAAHQPEAVVTDPIAADNHAAIPTELASGDHQQAARSRRILPWVLIIVAGISAGAFFWDSKDVEQYSALFTAHSKHEPPLAPKDDLKQAAAAPLSGEQEKRAMSEQLGALAARIDSLERALVSLKRAQSIGAVEEKPTTTETKPLAPENEGEGNGISTPDNPAAAKPPGGVPPTSDKPLIESVDRVGAIAVPTGAELDQRRATIGPAGCTHFRSFDAVSGTYTTLDGRRRPCR